MYGIRSSLSFFEFFLAYRQFCLVSLNLPTRNFVYLLRRKAASEGPNEDVSAPVTQAELTLTATHHDGSNSRIRVRSIVTGERVIHEA